MTIHAKTLTDRSIVLELENMDDWETFAADNRDALIDAYGSTARAYQTAIQGGLTLGGGAAPYVTVYWVDD